MEAKATAKYLRTSPRKMRRSIALIRGRQVDDARIALQENGGGVMGLEEAACSVTILQRSW